jgi:ATP-dependent Clp protease protease subunit
MREKGKRGMLPNTRILLPQPAVQGLGGQATDVGIYARGLVHTKRWVNEIMAAATGQPFEKIERDADRDYILRSEDAVEYGVIDRAVSRPSETVAPRSGG